MLYTKFQSHRPHGSEEGDFEGFYHIWAWTPSWSCNPEHLKVFSSQHPMEATYEIWLQTAQ